ncbi:MAG: hypothetical protein JST54_30785 [Deltaproteobacteria bacterium]|nr:hypothetical protein [Deltaproteobacteria bacterium]
MRNVIATFAVLFVAATAHAAASPTAMVGPGVGNVDLLVTQGLKDYNAGHYEQARDEFLKSLRAKPDNVPAYLSLARSYLQTKQIALSCWTYRVFLKAAPQSPDRDKAQAESENCQKQMAGLKPVPADPGIAFVDQKAAFQEAAEGGKLLGAGSASAVLEQMLKDGYAAPDLADMAAKLRTAAETAANTGYQKAVNHEDLDPVSLRNTAALFQLAQDVGATDATYAPRARFTEALANLQEHKYPEAEKGFASAMGAGNDKDAKFYAAVSVYRSGDHKRALQQLEKELPDDPRTKLLKVDAAIAQDPQKGAQELEKLLFDVRFKSS